MLEMPCTEKLLIRTEENLTRADATWTKPLEHLKTGGSWFGRACPVTYKAHHQMSSSLEKPNRHAHNDT